MAAYGCRGSNLTAGKDEEHRTTLRAFFLVILCTIFTSAGQILYKIGASRLSLNPILIIRNTPLLLGMLSYVIGAFLLILALREGELSVIYPIISTGFVWVSLFSARLFMERITLQRWMGIFTIILGVVLMGIGSRAPVQNREAEKSHRRMIGK